MSTRQTRPELDRRALPELWLITDERNDHALETALEGIGAPLGLIYRHYHLPPRARVERFFELQRIARRQGHLVILADSALTALEWGADGIYGAARALYPRRPGMLRLATAHSLREIGEANRIGADAVLLSPVFPTRSHPGARTLGPLRFRLLARHASVPVIALGGMDQARADRLAWPRWAAVDGLAQQLPSP